MRASRLSQMACACALVAGVVFAGGPIDGRVVQATTRGMDFSVARSLPYQTPDQVMFENVILNRQHLALLMKRMGVAFVPVQSRRLTTVQIPERTIAIDGIDMDWTGIPPVVSDPAGDQLPAYVSVDGTDIAKVYLAHDAEFLYFRMTLNNGGPITETQYAVEFQQYLYQLHTPGDITVWCENGGDGWAAIVRDRSGALRGSYPPQHEGTTWVAVGAGLLEWKARLADVQNPPDTPYPYFPAASIDRGIENRFIRVYINPVGIGVGVADETDPLTRPLIIGFYK